MWSRAAAVTSTVKDACRPAAEAITTTLPASVGAVRTPAAVIVPRDADHETVAPDTTLPYASVKLAVNVVVAPAATLADPESATAEAGPATIVTETVVDAGPAVTVTVPVPVPTAVAAVSTPLDVIVPSEELADHDSARPEIAFPKRSRGVPVKASVPPAATVAEPGETSIRLTAPGTTVTVTRTVRPPDATDKVPEPAA